MTSGETRELIFVVQGDITMVESGARRRFREAFDFLLLHFDNITVYSFYEDGIKPWDPAAVSRFWEEFPNVRLVLDHKTALHRLLTKSKQVLTVVFPSLAAQITKFRVPGLSPNFEVLKKSSKNPCFFLCGVDNLVDVNGMPDADIVVDTLDVKFLHYAIVKKLPTFDWRVIAKMRMEVSLLSCCDALVAISRSEAVVLNTLSPGRICFFVPSFLDQPKAVIRRKKDGYESDLLFVGTDYHFNLIGLLSFLTEHQAWLRPLRITIAGKVSLHRQIVELARTWPGITLLGFVDDLAPVYAAAKLAMSPVDGTGLKIKILEALRYGTPVVASKSSLDGLPDGFQDCVFPLDRASIERFLNDQSALDAAEQAIDHYLVGGAFTGPRDSLQVYLREKLQS